MKIHIAGNMDHTAFNYQNIVPLCRDIPGHIAGTGHVTDYGAGFQISRINNKVHRAGHGDHHIRLMQAGLHIRTDRKRGSTVPVQFLRQFFQRRNTPGNEIDMPHLTGQDTGTGRTDGAAGSDNSNLRVPQVFPHKTGSFPSTFQGCRYRITVAGRYCNIQTFRNRNSCITDDGSKSSQSEYFCSQLFCNLSGFHNPVDDKLFRQFHHLLRRQRTAYKPALCFRMRTLYSGNVRYRKRFFLFQNIFQQEIRNIPDHRRYHLHIL